MFIRKARDLTSLARVFVIPSNATHRQYEALRCYCVEGVSSAEAASRFGYTPGSFRVLVHQFRQDPQRQFFVPSAKPKAAARTDAVRQQILALRKQNLSVYDISDALGKEGISRSPVAVSAVLNQEGFARLPRRRDDERPARPRPTVADVADVRELNLEPKSFRTKFGGLFLFLPTLVELSFPQIIRQSQLPGTKMVPADCAMRSLLALKLFGTARRTHFMSCVLDEGLALFAGLNAIPKRSFLSEYSCRIEPGCYPRLMRHWFDAMNRLKLPRGRSFDLDFHTIPFHGEEALVEKHYISKRSRRQKGILAFLARDADAHVLCYANGQLRKEDQNDEVLQFVRFWKQRTGKLPEELIFDSKLTTYANLHQLNEQGVQFITLRRRSRKLLQEITAAPGSAWRRIELEGIARAYRTPRILDQKISLRDYPGSIRQIVIADLGHEEPTILLTNQMTRSAAKLIDRYARRMLIENQIEDGIDFFHMDALSSAVAMKVNCDLQLTLMASSLYRHFGLRIGNGYETAKSRHIFRDFIDATARVMITEREIVVYFQKRAHNPLLLAAHFQKTDIRVPWLGGKRLQFVFG